jgi:glycosyltransferase involved in cell wall biosynthesis
MIKVAVITPYFDESLSILAECHASVASQIHGCLHVIVADGRPLSDIDRWDAHHIKLPDCHHDVGSTPRLIGAYHAIGLGYDTIAFLDADNWFASDHILHIVNVIKTQDPDFISTNRYLCRPDGSVMRSCPYTDPKRFIDTSCMVFRKESFPLLANWVLMPQYGHPISDRIMLYHVLRSDLKCVHINKSTVFYRCYKEGIYRHFGESIPSGVVKPPDYKALFDLWIQDGHDPLV